jgi:15-cis-phytoene synthase
MSAVFAPPEGAGALEEAERACARLARRDAKNFYWGFIVLPRRRRVAIYSLYDFAREVDDEVDGKSCAEGAAGLARQRQRLADCLRGVRPDPVTAVLGSAIDRYGIPASELEEVIEGCEMDLRTPRYRDWEELSGYCRRVAGAIGRMCVRIFGCSDPEALGHADELGLALQVTNILRDVREDATMGRVYLPRDEMERFGLSEAELLEGRPGPGWERIVAHQAERARRLYEEGLRVCRSLSPSSAVCVRTMAGIYRRILERIARDPRHAYEHRVHLSTAAKLAVAARSWLP